MSTGMTGSENTSNMNETQGDKAETLVVISKVKRMIRDTAGMNTSQCCIDALTNKVMAVCKAAIESAKSSGRKTVMGKDIL